MTIDRDDPYGRAKYIEPKASGYFPGDLFNFGLQPQAITEGRTQPKFHSQVINSTPEGDVIYWRILIEDLRGGLNAAEGPFDEIYDRIYFSDVSGGLDTRYYRTLIPWQASVAANVDFNTYSEFKGAHYQMYKGFLHVAGGKNDAAVTEEGILFAEDSNGDMVDTGYQPPEIDSSIISLSKIVIGGASQPERLAIGYGNSPVQVIDDTYALDGAMHTDTEPCWGIIQTFINDDTMLIYANGAIRTLDKTNAISDQPEVALSNVPNGGYPLGLAKLGGGPIRAYWVWPHEEASPGLLSPANTNTARVVSTNLEGVDQQEVPMGLANITHACIFNDSAIVATDGQRIMLYDGRASAVDLEWLVIRKPNSDVIYYATNLFTNGTEIGVEYQVAGKDTTTVGSDLLQVDIYDTNNNSWHHIGQNAVSSSDEFTTLLSKLVHISGNPVSTTTGYLQTVEQAFGFRKFFLPLPGYNPFYQRQTSGATAGTGLVVEASGTVQLPEWELPGLEGMPKVIRRVVFMGDLDADDIASFVGVKAGSKQSVEAGTSIDATFTNATAGEAQERLFEDNTLAFYKLTVEIRMLNDGSSGYSPNALPIMIEGYAFSRKMALPPFRVEPDV